MASSSSAGAHGEGRVDEFQDAMIAAQRSPREDKKNVEFAEENEDPGVQHSAAAAVAAAAAAAEIPEEELRTAYCARLSDTPFLDHKHPLFKHGRAYDGPMTEPTVLWKSGKAPRDDHECPKWLTATEFQDEAEVARAKVRQLADLLRVSKKTVLYTGAGISAAVVGQAARSGQNTVGWKGDTRRAKPTFTHYALGLLGQQGLVHSWVQQNHDGLPQKAGFPQDRINEIHGSWYDPSNPVVKYSGSLHDRSYPWMVDDAETADLALVLGTSLGGLNADQVATETAKRSTIGASLGTVCINLQQTEQDGKMSLRLFGKSDDLLRLLLRELGMKTPLNRNGAPPPLLRAPWPKESRILVPYDAEGRRLRGAGSGSGSSSGTTAAGGRRLMWLDLTAGQKVRITPGHNIQGAKQPMYMHIGGKKPVTYQGVTRQPGKGLGVVVGREEDTGSFVLQIEGVQMRLGIWWLEAAARGGVEALPVVNQNPVFEEEEEKPSSGGGGRAAAKAPAAAKSSARPKRSSDL